MFKRGRQESARFRSDQGEKRRKRLVNNRGFQGKGLLSFLYLHVSIDDLYNCAKVYAALALNTCNCTRSELGIKP